MEGLEISEIDFKYVKNSNEEFRIDSNYFRKHFVKEESLIKSISHKTLKELKVSLLSFGAYSLNNFVEYKTEGVPFIRGINMKAGRISFSNMIYIDINANKLLWKSEVEPETVLLSMSGTIGEVAIASKNWKYPINSNQDIAKIRTNGNINPYYLYAFLVTRFGQNYLIREARGSVQQHVYLSQMELFDIPIFSLSFEKSIEHIVLKAEDILNKSERNYDTAEKILLEEIGLKDFQPSQEPVNIKNFKDSFAAYGRLDAEYYQPKYDDYINIIKNYQNGYSQLHNVCNLRDTNFNPEDNTKYNYIELSNVGKTGEVNGCTTEFGVDLPSRARRVVRKNDVIISSIEGSLQSCALVGDEYDNALCSTGFYVINSNIINSETLLVLFKSEPMQNILKQNCSGTILTAINKNEFLNIPIPKIEKNVQEQIAQLIKESFKLKSQSEKLLEVAKRAVEIAIEENEDVAMKFINQNN